MISKKLFKLADVFEDKLKEVDPSVVVTEHEGVELKKKLTSKEVAEDPDSCINKGLRRWKCRCN